MFWIEAHGRLAIAARPRAHDWLDDEIERWRSASVNVVVSLLEPEEVLDLGLEAESDSCAKAGIAFISFPIPDRGVPVSLAKTRELVAKLEARLVAGDGVLIHCRAGIGRSSLIAACLLMALGEQCDEAFQRIATVRGLPVPDTPAQTSWAASFTAA